MSGYLGFFIPPHMTEGRGHVAEGAYVVDESLALEKHGVYNYQTDNFCSGLVTKVYWVERRLYQIPFETCIISHSAIVCETAREKAYMIEFCEGSPIMIHDVTQTWSFQPASRWNYGGYTY